MNERTKELLEQIHSGGGKVEGRLGEWDRPFLLLNGVPLGNRTLDFSRVMELSKQDYLSYNNSDDLPWPTAGYQITQKGINFLSDIE